MSARVYQLCYTHADAISFLRINGADVVKIDAPGFNNYIIPHKIPPVHQ
ncbi:hypothetical protein HK413_01650 [Mucilaginibacter sp. S1162]|uniref:Uncharacterized protein n=1 Tax=Mucilaginibacter humi TaxID=2732510 RepID=A0ABX1VZU7_9SPHI|nr:hypothetical protein [Mucilaginibacter humi]